MRSQSPTILILAGKRDGRIDPLAERAGVDHKCIVPIEGKPLIVWVLEAAEAAWPGGRILVSIHDAEAIAGLPIVGRLTAAGRLTIVEAQAGLVDSIHAAVDSGSEPFPLLITTADNVLATPESLRDLDAGARAQEAGAAVALARREAIVAAHPDAQRRFYEFRDVSVSNCNAYWVGDRAALAAAESFRGGGQFIKRAGAIVQAFGIGNLIRFRLGWWSLDAWLQRISKRFGVRIVAHFYDDGALAVDVDNERTYAIAEMLLAARLK